MWAPFSEPKIYVKAFGFCVAGNTHILGQLVQMGAAEELHQTAKRLEQEDQPFCRSVLPGGAGPFSPNNTQLCLKVVQSDTILSTNLINIQKPGATSS